MAYHTQLKHLALSAHYANIQTTKWSALFMQIDTAANFISANKFEHSLYMTNFSNVIADNNFDWILSSNKLTVVINQNDGWHIGLARMAEKDCLLNINFVNNWSLYNYEKDNFIGCTDGGYFFAGYCSNVNSILLKADKDLRFACDTFTYQLALTPQLANTAALSIAIAPLQAVKDTPAYLSRAISLKSTLNCADSIITTTNLPEGVATSVNFLLSNVVNHNHILYFNPNLKISDCRIYNPNGVLVFSNVGLVATELRLPGLESGIYFAKTRIGEKEHAEKLVVVN